MKMYIDGQWADSPTMSPVISPYFREVLDTVPEATADQVGQALAAAEQGAITMSRLTAHDSVECALKVHRAGARLAGVCLPIMPARGLKKRGRRQSQKEWIRSSFFALFASSRLILAGGSFLSISSRAWGPGLI